MSELHRGNTLFGWLEMDCVCVCGGGGGRRVCVWKEGLVPWKVQCTEAIKQIKNATHTHTLSQ